MADKGRKRASARNPAQKAGRGKTAAEHAKDLRMLIREEALTALKRLANLSRSEDERVALAATQELLNRAFGKASTAAAGDVAAPQPLIVKIVKFGENGGSQGEEQS